MNVSHLDKVWSGDGSILKLNPNIYFMKYDVCIHSFGQIVINKTVYSENSNHLCRVACIPIEYIIYCVLLTLYLQTKKTYDASRTKRNL